MRKSPVLTCMIRAAIPLRDRFGEIVDTDVVITYSAESYQPGFRGDRIDPPVSPGFDDINFVSVRLDDTSTDSYVLALDADDVAAAEAWLDAHKADAEEIACERQADIEEAEYCLRTEGV